MHPVFRGGGPTNSLARIRGALDRVMRRHVKAELLVIDNFAVLAMDQTQAGLAFQGILAIERQSGLDRKMVRELLFKKWSSPRMSKACSKPSPAGRLERCQQNSRCWGTWPSRTSRSSQPTAARCRRDAARLVLLSELWDYGPTREAIAEVMATGRVGAEYVEYATGRGWRPARPR